MRDGNVRIREYPELVPGAIEQQVNREGNRYKSEGRMQKEEFSRSDREPLNFCTLVFTPTSDFCLPFTILSC
jgi:hypothetical protein